MYSVDVFMGSCFSVNVFIRDHVVVGTPEQAYSTANMYRLSVLVVAVAAASIYFALSLLFVSSITYKHAARRASGRDNTVVHEDLRCQETGNGNGVVRVRCRNS